MVHDASHGWNAIAHQFLDMRSDTGSDVVRRWARLLPIDAAVVDIGCGSGIPVSAILVKERCTLFGIDASPVMVAEFRRGFPDAEAACEAAETSALFHRAFDGAVAIGLLFLLPPEDQRQVIERVGQALKPKGRFLFTAPREACTWEDSLTGRLSVSFGEDGYRQTLEDAGMSLVGQETDEGQNHYYSAVRT